MVWTAPKTFTASTVLTAAELNEQVRDNLLECAPNKATTPGGFFVSTAPNTLAQRIVHKHTILATGQTTSLSYVNITDSVGPTVSLTTGTEALAIWGAELLNGSAGFSSFVSITCSGATTVAADSDEALRVMSAANEWHQLSQFKFFNDLNPGTNIFKLQYAVGGGTGSFRRRRLVIFPY